MSGSNLVDRDIVIKEKNDTTITKKPGEVNGLEFKLISINRSKILILDHSSEVLL